VPLVVIVGAVVAADQATKEIARTAFAAGESAHVAGSLWVSPFYNPGVDGGGLQGKALPLALFGLIAILGIFGFLAYRHALRPIVLLGFGLLVGGGIGNFLDRLRFGSVSDFIVRGETAFNLADVAIYAGGMIVFVALIAQLPRLLAHSAR
jgi:signal peptidase II